jgi:phosphoglycerate dehydrogenase-like enzyme
MKSFQVARANLSPYQRENFTALEKKAFESIPGISYVPLSALDFHQEIVLVTNTHTKLSELDPQMLASVKLIIHPNSGYDNWAQEKAFWENIPVVIGHRIRAQAVAEYTLGCLMNGALRLPEHKSWDKERKWDRKLLSEMTVAVVGCGHIGSKVAGTLKTLGSKVFVIDPHKQVSDYEAYEDWKKAPLEKADAILICCGLNESSEHLISKEFLERSSSDVILVNGARGKIIDSAALRSFLKAHPKAQAFLDVFEEEPFGKDWEADQRTWKTSHIAGVFNNLDQAIIDFGKEVLKDFVTLSESKFQEKYRNEILQNKFSASGGLI